METLQIILGLAIIIITFLDFFHTTLSGNGFGWISEWLNRTLNRLIIKNRSRSIYNYSGVIHLLLTTFVWMALHFSGTYLIFTAGENMVINGTTFVPATYAERFYFTGYMLSTLGIGDFTPGNDTSRILVGILSFSGFILITTGLTYLLSVVSAVLSKKELSFYISTVGKDYEGLYHYFKKQDELEFLMSDSSDLRQQILKNASSYLSFPMVNYFLTKKRNSALILQLARLHEVLTVLQLDWGEDTIQRAKIQKILNAIEKYLKIGIEGPESAIHKEEKLRTLRGSWKKYGYDFPDGKEIDPWFTSSLKYAGWDWDDVYKLDPE
ncbi:potassium channel family protein [Salinimicrobium flavum]|uniref:Potassium channel family protein n=1 Tax=Salinimicrobium flavum TaxID=1737065 RepID=A0ABW5ITQ1_9FLAO